MIMQSLPDGARRVQDILSIKGSSSQVCLLSDSTATAKDAAAALGVEVRQIGKSIVFGSKSVVIVAVICGDQRVDPEALARLLGTQDVRPLKAEEVKACTGYVIGGVSPFGLPSGVKIVVDSALSEFADCYVAAGHPKAVVRTNGKELIAFTGASVASVAH